MTEAHIARSSSKTFVRAPARAAVAVAAALPASVLVAMPDDGARPERAAE